VVLVVLVDASVVNSVTPKTKTSRYRAGDSSRVHIKKNTRVWKMASNNPPNRLMERLSGALVDAVARNVLDALTPPRPRNSREAPSHPTERGAADGTIFIDDDDSTSETEEETLNERTMALEMTTMSVAETREEDARRMNEVYIGLFPTRADAAATLARVLYQNLRLEGDPTRDIKVVATTRNPRSSYAFVRLRSREDVETLLSLSPLNLFGGSELVTVQLSNYASSARGRAAEAASRVIPTQPPPPFSTLTAQQVSRMNPEESPLSQILASSGSGGAMALPRLNRPVTRHSSRVASGISTLQQALQNELGVGGRGVKAAVTSTKAAHATLRKQTLEQRQKLQQEFQMRFGGLEEEISDLEEQQRQVTRERQRLESQLEENTQKGANLTTKKEILMAKFCKYSEAHEAEIQDLDRRLAALKSNCPEDEAEDTQQKENKNPGQTPLRNRMTTALECPCCYNDMRTDIFQCSNGHLICKTCLRRLKECPVCRTNYPRDPIRALFAEQMAQNLGNNS